MKVSVRDISRKTGFSPATVSNALNHKHGVSKATAEIVLKAAREMGYQRPSKLSSIEFTVMRKTGKILDEGDFYPVVIDGVEREANLHDLSVTYANIDLGDPTSLERINARTQSPNGGIILLGTEMDEEDYAPLHDCKAPLVVVDGWCMHSFMESIVIANESSAYTATRYLIGRGHRRIGYLQGATRIRNFPLRERGYRAALSEAGIAYNDRYRVVVGTSLTTAYEASRRWLAGSPELPTAFFAEDDTIACGMMRALLEAGYRVPEDVSLVGFDDTPVASAMLPGLTTIHVPKHDIGAIAVQKLIEQARAPHRYTCTTHISTTFVERGSVATL